MHVRMASFNFSSFLYVILRQVHLESQIFLTLN
jgi:hypothetical protein